MPVIRKLLVANRGEIASRIFRTARSMDIRTVAVYSDPDAHLPFAGEADEAVHLPGSTPAETYLRAEAVIDAARRTGADAVHPGYGFLSENAGFARISSLAAVFEPIASMASGDGPTKVRPATAQARAKPAFSDRKP